MVVTTGSACVAGACAVAGSLASVANLSTVGSAWACAGTAVCAAVGIADGVGFIAVGSTVDCAVGTSPTLACRSAIFVSCSSLAAFAFSNSLFALTI